MRVRFEIRRIVAVSVLAAAALGGAGTAGAEEAMAPGPIASTWILWPKAGEAAALEAGIKAHAAWRKGAGEEWKWEIFEPVVGEDLTHYVVRSEGHQWADLDANETWGEAKGVFAKYMEQVGAHVGHIEHYLGEFDAAHSNWKDDDAYRYFGVTSITVRPGTHGQMLQALDRIHGALVAQNWPRSWAIEMTVGGDGGMVIVQPYTGYAGMAEPEPGFFAVLAQGLGSPEAAGEALGQLGQTFESESYTIYRYRADLSTPK
jgi:hypothetical protein